MPIIIIIVIILAIQNSILFDVIIAGISFIHLWLIQINMQ